MKRSNPENRVFRFEMYVSGLGLAICLLTTYLIWRSLAPNQGMWLLPGLYFLELTIGSTICFLAYFRQQSHSSTISWMYSGVLLVFIVLASFTVGLFYTPVFLIFSGLSIYSVIRHCQNLPSKLGLFIVSVLVQLAFMLFFVRVLYY